MINNENKTDPASLPSLVLAYIGDAIYEVHIRTLLVSRGIVKVNELHKEAVKYVRAEAQARILHALEGTLSPEEEAVVKRGRNAKSGRVPKNAEMIDYRYSTAFESLIGYLHLSGRKDRLDGILGKVDNLLQDRAE